MDKHLLDKWLNSNHTAQDLDRLRSYPEFAAYEKIDAHVKQIEIPSFNVQTGLKDLKSRLPEMRKDTKVRVLPTLLKIAAILVVLLASYVYINSLPTTVTTQIAETQTQILPDNSEVLLNENSEISFNDNDWENNREISLQGEAYFKVAKGQKFTVSTSNGIVTVLGTQFNVHDSGNTFNVSCYEGLVSVTHNGNVVKLPQGKAVSLKNGQLSVTDVFVNKPVWLNNESSYDDVLISNVLQDLEKTYGTTTTTKNIDVTLRYTGSYTHNDLEAALQTVTIPLGLTYTIESDNSVTISQKIVSE